MAKLGSFSVVQRTVAAAEKPREPDTFDFEGETFHVVRSVPSMLPLMQFSAAMASADDEDDSFNMDALGAMYNMLRYCIEPADWARFEKTALRAGAGVDALLPITMAVWESISSDPTEGPSDLQDGPSITSTSSKAASPRRKAPPSSTGRRTAEPSPVDVSAKTPANEWAPPPGRPDLAVPLTPVDDLVKRRRGKAA
jgi:hypothetical protein